MLPSDIVAKLHECAAANFAVARDSWFIWLSRSTKCVVAGLILELPELVYETRGFARNRIGWFRYKIVLLENRLEIAKLVAFVGWLFIVAGVAGEWYSGAKIDDLSARIQGCNEARLTEVTEQSSDANARASEAYERASKNEKETAETLKQAQQERADAAKSLKIAKGYESQIAEAQREAAESKKEAETERLERVQLETLVAPRRLSLDQQRRIADACRKFHGHGVLVKSYGADGEGAALAGQIIAVLRAAGVFVADSRASETVAGEFDIGVHVRAPVEELAFAQTIADALSTLGKLEVSPVNDPEPKSGTIMMGGGQRFADPHAVFVTVRVGIRPVPILPAK
jgi:hypothetical protein